MSRKLDVGFTSFPILLNSSVMEFTEYSSFGLPAKLIKLYSL